MAYTPGPFDAPHYYIQWGGKLPGNESWSCGLRMSSEDPALTNSTALALNIGNVVRNFHINALAHINPNALLSFVKFNGISIDGTYASDETFETIYADVPGGGASTPVYPNQIALAVSLTTGFSRGAAHRGRFYLPSPSIEVETDGLILAADAVQVGTAVDSLIVALNALDAGMATAVFSRKLGAAAHRRITGNEVGRVLDTQRRRRRSLVEDYR